MKKFFAIVFAVILIGWGLIMTLGYIVKLNRGMSESDETLFLITVIIFGWLPMLFGFALVYWLIRSSRASQRTSTTVQNFTTHNTVNQLNNTVPSSTFQKKKEINSQNYFE